MEIRCCQAIPVNFNTKSRSIRHFRPALIQQVAIRHAKLKGFLGHRRLEVPGAFIGQHQVEIGDLGQGVIPALDLD